MAFALRAQGCRTQRREEAASVGEVPAYAKRCLTPKCGPESFFYYRNNAAGGGGGTGPTVRNTSSFDIWGYGCLHKPASAVPTDAWEVNNWE